MAHLGIFCALLLFAFDERASFGTLREGALLCKYANAVRVIKMQVRASAITSARITAIKIQALETM